MNKNVAAAASPAGSTKNCMPKLPTKGGTEGLKGKRVGRNGRENPWTVWNPVTVQRLLAQVNFMKQNYLFFVFPLLDKRIEGTDEKCGE